MTLLRCFLFAWCIAWAAGSYAQESSAEHSRVEGAKARLTLLSPISSKSPSGSSFMAKVEDAVAVDGKPVLPQGTLVEGHLETIPARRMMRRGRLAHDFRSPQTARRHGTTRARFELACTESNAAKTDSEGIVHPTVSKKRLAIQLGGTALVAKLADDISEEALATTAGSARWYGLAASTAFLLLQKGREVKLKSGEVIEVDLVRSGPTLP